MTLEKSAKLWSKVIAVRVFFWDISEIREKDPKRGNVMCMDLERSKMVIIRLREKCPSSCSKMFFVPCLELLIVIASSSSIETKEEKIVITRS